MTGTVRLQPCCKLRPLRQGYAERRLRQPCGKAYVCWNGQGEKNREGAWGGKGKLTNVVMKRLTSFYATALKDNAPDVVQMQKGVFASLLHSYSTDAEPLHQACPQGEDSWCHLNRHKALVAAGKPSAPRPHRPAFSRDIAKELVPLYNRLSDKTLLARCCRMRTQNANESYNALV